MKQDILKWYERNLARKWYALTPLQKELLQSNVRTDLPRRSGKTTCVIIRALYEALTKPSSSVLIVVDYDLDYLWEELKNFIFLMDSELALKLIRYRIDFYNNSRIFITRNNSHLISQVHGHRVTLLITDEVLELDLSPGVFFSMFDSFSSDKIYRLATDR